MQLQCWPKRMRKSIWLLLGNYKVSKLTKFSPDRWYTVFTHIKKLRHCDINFSGSEFLNMSRHVFCKWHEIICRLFGTHFACNLVICIPGKTFFLIMFLLLFGHSKIIFTKLYLEVGSAAGGKIQSATKTRWFWWNWEWCRRGWHVRNQIRLEFDSSTIHLT